MKTKLNLAKCAFFALVFSISVTAQETVITKAALPAKATKFLKTHFAGQETTYVLQDEEPFSTEYKVQLKNGVQIEFDGNGNLTEIEGNNATIPAKIIPKEITYYLKANFSNEPAIKIDKGTWGYEVNLRNGMELEFNSKGKFLRIDN